jgi:hypothetical protein
VNDITDGLFESFTLGGGYLIARAYQSLQGAGGFYQQNEISGITAGNGFLDLQA